MPKKQNNDLSRIFVNTRSRIFVCGILAKNVVYAIQSRQLPFSSIGSNICTCSAEHRGTILLTWVSPCLQVWERASPPWDVLRPLYFLSYFLLTLTVHLGWRCRAINSNAKVKSGAGEMRTFFLFFVAFPANLASVLFFIIEKFPATCAWNYCRLSSAMIERVERELRGET